MSNNTKKLRCKISIASDIIKEIGFNPFKNLYNKSMIVRNCMYGDECIGAHNNMITKLPHITKWEKIDISTFNFAELYYNILNVINKDKKHINSSYCEFNFDKLEELKFIDLIQLWQKIACVYRKLANNLPKKNAHIMNKPSMVSGYTYYEDVPQFKLLDHYEDHAWAFERMTHLCKQNNNVNMKIETLKRLDRNKITPNELLTINELCIGDCNCKQGVHNINELVCIEDFYTGKCNCLSPSEISSQNEELELCMALLGNNKSPKYFLLKEKQNKLKNTIRKIHYSERGMLPFNDQLEEYKVFLENERIKLEEQTNKLKIQDTMNTDIKIGKVIKLKLKV